MGCDIQCGKPLNISSLLAELPKNSWQTVSINLKCFSDTGVDFSRVNAPFSLSTQGKLTLSIADIALLPQADNQQASIDCQ